MRCIKCKTDLPDDSLFCSKCGKKQASAKPAPHTKRPNGTGSIYKEGDTWTIDITRGYTTVFLDDDKKKRVRKRKRYRGFPTKSAAMKKCTELLDAPDDCKAPTLESIWLAWSTSDMKKLSANKQTSYKIAHNKLLKTDIAFKEITALRVQDLQSAMDSQCTTYYPSRDFKNLLSKLYQRAMADQDVVSNLALLLTLPPLEEAEPEPFLDVEQVKLWNAYSNGNTFIGYILLMIYTGMMPGELFDCKKSQIEWDNYQIVGAGKKTKTRKTSALVFPDIMEPVLQELCKYSQSKKDKLLCMSRDNFYKEYYIAIEAAGCRPLPPYSCRHTTGTALARENLPLAVIQKIMRHAKYSSTQRYIHPDAQDMRSAINLIATDEVIKVAQK